MNLIKSEFKKIIQETLTYYPDFIVGSSTHFILFFLLVHGRDEDTLIIFSYVLWIMASGVLSEASITISMEKQLGTLQNLLIKPYSILHIVIVKTVVWFFINLLKIMIFLLILSFFYSITPIFRFDILCILIVACLGVMGLALILSALTLIFTKVASFEVVISYILLMLSGSIVNIPSCVRYTNPISMGNYCVSLILYSKIELFHICVLAIISIFYFIIGIVIFRLVFQNSKQFRWTY